MARRGSWKHELDKKYNQILYSPRFGSKDLDDANDAILKAIAKLTKIIKRRK